jgi:catechol 2,3-dioxygenase
MNRKDFIKNILGTSVLIGLDGISSITNAMTQMTENKNSDELYATFGAIHLNNTSLEKAKTFWTTIMGLKLRKSSADSAEFGSENKTLVVVHQAAKTAYKEGYSGLYHFAIHLSKSEFAKALYRLQHYKYPCSPIDHTMSKSIYLNDPDGITIEFAQETPERFKRVVTEGGLRMEDANGTIRSASAQLDLDVVLKELKDTDLSKPVSDNAKIGHIHLYANNVESSDAFYKKLGFEQFNYFPQFMYADVSCGGPYKHRVAMNSWHGMNKPLAPKDSAGMKHYHIIFDTKDMLDKAVKSVSNVHEKDGVYWVNDPTGNLVLLSSKA